MLAEEKITSKYLHKSDKFIMSMHIVKQGFLKGLGVRTVTALLVDVIYVHIFAVLCMVIIDFLAFYLSFLVAALLLSVATYIPVDFFPGGIALIGCTIFLLKKSYVRHLSYMLEAVEILRITSEVFLLGAFFLLIEPYPFTIFWLVLAWLNSLYLVPAARYLGKSGLFKAGIWDIPLESVAGPSLKAQGVMQLSWDCYSFRAGVFIKRILDVVLAVTALLLGSLPLSLISLILKIDSRGPIFFAHTRVGRNGQLFKCWKFRTMYQKAEEVLTQLFTENPGLKKEWEEIGKLKDDPRVTRIGKLLRKTSLDELPQLLNVLKGEMSLVGPRPLSPRWLEKFGQQQAVRLQIRPGITGLWQVSGRNDLEFSERIQLDSWYIQNWSIWLDIIILFRTVLIVLNGRGAY